MKLSSALHIGVFIGLLFAATLCLRFHDTDIFSRLQDPRLSNAFVSKLESNPSLPEKESLVAAVKALVESEASGLKALQSNAELITGLGELLLTLAFLQGLGIYFSWRSRKNST